MSKNTQILVDKLFEADPMAHAENNPRAAQAARHGKTWCHMWHENHNVDELVAFAKKLGLKWDSIQGLPSFPHFDLTPEKRALAIERGAKEVNLREWLRGKRE